MGINLFELIKKRRLFLGYFIIGGVATIIDMGLLFIFVEYFKIWYIYSSIMSFMIAAIFNFSMNKYFNFRNKSNKIFVQFVMFALVALVGVILNTILLYILVEFVKLWYMIAKIITAAIVLFWNYNINKRFTFKILE
jgi:putative flippase GtrA